MFSAATIMDVMGLLQQSKTHASLTEFTIRYKLNNIGANPNISLQSRVNIIGQYLIDNPNAKGVISDNLVFEIVEQIINETQGEYYFDPNENEYINYPQLRKLLLRDGFVIQKGKLIRQYNNIENEENESLLEKLLKKHNLTTAKGHYDQAYNAFNRGDWASCNAQIRTYVESLLNDLALMVTGHSHTGSQQAKISLANSNPPLFYRSLNEWLDNGQGFFETFWKRLHTEGSHPGLSDEDDASFRLNLVQITTLEILRRFDKHYS